MKLQHLLAVSCAMLGTTVYADSKPSAVLMEMAQPATPATATAEQRLALFPSLADIPKDVCVVTTVGDLRKAADSLMQQPILAPLVPLMGKSPAEIIKQIPDVTSATIAIARDAEPSLSGLSKLSNANSMEMVFQLWSMSAADPAMVDELSKALAAQLTSGVKLELPSIYVSASFAKDSASLKQVEEMLMTTVNQLFSQATPEDLAKTGLTKQEVPGGIAVGVNIDFLIEMSLGEANTAIVEQFKTAIEQLKGKKAYVVISREGDRLRVVLTGKLDQTLFPATPADSVASSTTLDFSNQELGKNPLIICSTQLSPEFIKSDKVVLQTMLEGLNSVFTATAAKNSPMKQTMDAGSKALSALGTSYINLIEQLSSNTYNLVVWADGDLNIELESKVNYTTNPGKLVGLPLIDASSTVMYGEIAGSTGLNLGMNFNELIDNSVALTEAVAMTLNDDYRKEALPVITVAKGFIPDIKQLVANLCTSCSGMSTPAGVIMDINGQSPNFLNGEAAEVRIPRVSLFTTVTDRAAIAKGWEDAKNTAKLFLSKVGQDASMVDLIATVETQQDGMTLHSPSMPIFPAELKPNIVISDKLWTLGSSPSYNTEVQKGVQASAGTPFTGSVFALKTAPIAALITEMSKGAKPDSGDARDMQQAKQVADYIQLYVDGIYATGTVEGDKNIMRVRVDMKDAPKK